MVYGKGVMDLKGCSNTPQYVRWMSMIQRCYDEGALERDPSYIGVTVCDEWLTFSNFKAWMDRQDWEGKVLDKDLSGNREYSPDNCVFIPEDLNKFMTGGRSKTGGLLGTSYEKDRRKWKASLKCPTSGRKLNLGRYNTEQDAHEVYLMQKGLILMGWSAEIDDTKVKKLMQKRAVEMMSGTYRTN